MVNYKYSLYFLNRVHNGMNEMINIKIESADSEIAKVNLTKI